MNVMDEVTETYVYGYPFVYNLTEIGEFVEGGSSFPLSAPLNEFARARRLLGPEIKFVSPNNDTLYVLAACDVRNEPLVLHVPDTQERYYVLQFVDAWTNNFAYVGKRATGTSEASYLLAPRDYNGEMPEGIKDVIKAPSGVFMIVGRVQVDGEDDLPAVHALQDRFELTPLSAFLGEADASPAEPAGLPRPDPRVGKGLVFWEKLRVALAAFPPPPDDMPFLVNAEKLGLLAKKSPYVKLKDPLAKRLKIAQKAGAALIEGLLEGGSSNAVNGWSSSTHAFDYNLDYLGLGTVDSPEWKIPDRNRAYVLRAIAARAGLWGNHGYEASYSAVYVDADGDHLNGANSYELLLEQTPAVDAFWSLTMYDVPDFYLVENPIDRYSIGDRTPGLVFDDDGSLTIYMQKDSPGPDRESNWLPTPEGDFRPIMRMYMPQEAVLDGSYVLPAIEKVG